MRSRSPGPLVAPLGLRAVDEVLEAAEAEQVLRRLDAVTAELEQASQDQTLPAKPDVEAVDAFVVSAYRRAWDEGLTA